MEKQDIEVVCKDCGETFLFSVGEQEFYEKKGFDKYPASCKACRDKKKAERNNRRDNNE